MSATVSPTTFKRNSFALITLVCTEVMDTSLTTEIAALESSRNLMCMQPFTQKIAFTLITSACTWWSLVKWPAPTFQTGLLLFKGSPIANVVVLHITSNIFASVVLVVDIVLSGLAYIDNSRWKTFDDSRFNSSASKHFVIPSNTASNP